MIEIPPETRAAGSSLTMKRAFRAIVTWRADTQFWTKRHIQNVIFDGIGRRMVNTDMKDIRRRIAGIWSLGI
jgi:hypothetical protein